MIRIMKNTSGFTMLEVLVAVALAAILMGSIGGFLISSTKSYNTAQELVDMQYQGQLVMNILEEELMYAANLSHVYDLSHTEKGNAIDETSVSLLCLEKQTKLGTTYLYYKLAAAEEESNLYVFEASTSGLNYGDTALAPKDDNLLATHIESIHITPRGVPFSQADSFSIRLNLKRNEKELELINHVYMRNSTN